MFYKASSQVLCAFGLTITSTCSKVMICFPILWKARQVRKAVVWLGASQRARPFEQSGEYAAV